MYRNWGREKREETCTASPPITPEYLVARPENPRTASKVETGREMPALFLKAYCTQGSPVSKNSTNLSKNSINTEGFQYKPRQHVGLRVSSNQGDKVG